MAGLRLRRRHYVYGAVGLACLIVVIALLRETHREGERGEIWHEAAFFGSVLVTIGWIVTSEVNIGNSKRQHTITLLTQHAFDRARAENRDIITQALPTYRTRLTPAIVAFDDENSRLLKAIDLELNFYEFLAVGCANDDLDERLFKRALRTQFCNFYQQMEDYVAHWQAKNASTWSEISSLYRKWQNDDVLAAALVRLYGGGP